MQIISIIMALIVFLLVIMNYQDSVTINIISEKIAELAHLPQYSFLLNSSVYTLGVFILGEISALCFFAPLYKSLKEKFNAYKRELEKGSISNSNGEAKIKVLENKINVLEKALDEALKKND